MRRLAENVIDSVSGIRELMKEMRELSQAAVAASEAGTELGLPNRKRSSNCDKGSIACNERRGAWPLPARRKRQTKLLSQSWHPKTTDVSTH